MGDQIEVFDSRRFQRTLMVVTNAEREWSRKKVTEMEIQKEVAKLVQRGIEGDPRLGMSLWLR